MSSLHPTVLWAQRKDRLYLTFDLQDCKVRAKVMWVQADGALKVWPAPRCDSDGRVGVLQDPQISVENNEETKSGKVSFKGHAHSHATGGCTGPSTNCPSIPATEASIDFDLKQLSLPASVYRPRRTHLCH